MAFDKKEYDKNYLKEYSKNTLKQIKFVLNTNTDTDIIEWLDAQPNKQGYIKELIRADIQKNNNK